MFIALTTLVQVFIINYLSGHYEIMPAVPAIIMSGSVLLAFILQVAVYKNLTKPVFVSRWTPRRQDLALYQIIATVIVCWAAGFCLSYKTDEFIALALALIIGICLAIQIMVYRDKIAALQKK